MARICDPFVLGLLRIETSNHKFRRIRMDPENIPKSSSSTKSETTSQFSPSSA